MSDWCIKLPGHIKPVVEEQARAEYLPPTDYVRAIVQREIFARQLERVKAQQPNSNSKGW